MSLLHLFSGGCQNKGIHENKGLNWGAFALGGHLSMPEDNFGCQDAGGGILQASVGRG